MKLAIPLGVIIAIVVVAACFIVPPLFPTPAQQQQAALQQATLALRELHAHDDNLPRIADMADVNSLKDADLQRLIDRSQESFDKLHEKLAEEISTAQQRDARLKLPKGNYQAPQTTATGLKSAVAGFASLLEQNRAAYADALKAARAAQQSGRTVLGVSQVAGIVEWLSAAALLTDAQRLRSTVEAQDARVIELASDWRLAKAEVEHYSGLDVTEIVAALHKDLDEATRLHAAAAAQQSELAGHVAEREKLLTDVRAALAKEQAARDQIEKQAFTPGDDSGFNAYRDTYLQSSQRMRLLQEQELELASGSLKDAAVDEDDITEGELTGGTPVQGLDELKRRLALSKEATARLASGMKTIEERIRSVEQSGTQAGEMKAVFVKREQSLKSDLDNAAEAASATAAEATKKEDEAIQTAERAIAAFRETDSAAQAWQRAAQETKREKDPNSQNARLKVMENDAVVQQIGTSAAAEARLLLGRVHSSRAAALGDHMRAMQRFTDLVTGSTFDKDALQAALDSSREAGLKALNDAAQDFEKLATKSATAPTGWIPQVSLATTYYLLSKLDTAQGSAFRTKATEALTKALEKREQSPYLAPYVRFRDHLATASTGN